MKKYKREIKSLLIFFIVIYLIPITLYITNSLDHKIINNLLFVVYPLSYFIISSYESKKTANFYVMPILYAILYIPLVFTIYSSKYLACFFIYIFVAILGGLFGYWCNTNKEVANAFKKAFGILAVVATLFISALIIVNIIYGKCDYYICNLNDIVINNLYLIIIIVLLVLFAIHCLKKEKKKD